MLVKIKTDVYYKYMYAYRSMTLFPLDEKLSRVTIGTVMILVEICILPKITSPIIQVTHPQSPAFKVTKVACQLTS